MAEPATETWILLRHGESTANAARTLSGWQDVGLTPLGEAQARAAGASLASMPISRVLCSDLTRAYQTAEIAARAWAQARGTDVPRIVAHKALRERRMGELQGCNLDALRAQGRTRNLIEWTGRPPGGESLADIAARALPWLATQGPSETTLVVAHGGVLRTLLGLMDRMPTDQIGTRAVANCAPQIRALEAGAWARMAAQL